MGTGEVIGHIQQMDIENRRLKEALEQATTNKVDASKFYAVAVGTETIARLHGVHVNTVQKYIALGLIDKHPDSTDGKILVRGSVALLLDFSELRRQARTLVYNK